MTITRKSKKLLLDIRREDVLKYTSRGYSQREIAKQINVSPASVNNDLRYLRTKARENVSEYVNKTLPTEIEVSLVRLQQIIKKCFEDIENPDTTTKEKHDAAIVIKDCTALRLEILGSGVLADTLAKSASVSASVNSSVSSAYSGATNSSNDNERQPEQQQEQQQQNNRST